MAGIMSWSDDKEATVGRFSVPANLESRRFNKPNIKRGDNDTPPMDDFGSQERPTYERRERSRSAKKAD